MGSQLRETISDIVGFAEEDIIMAIYNINGVTGGADTAIRSYSIIHQSNFSV